MALKTLVKVGSITNLSDARYCAGMGVDFLGFRLIEGQPGLIPIRTLQEIRGWVTGPQIVAEVYGISTGEELRRIMEEAHPDFLELSLEEFDKVGALISIPYILRIGDLDTLPGDLATKPAYLLTERQISSATSRYIPEFEVLVNISSMDELETATAQTGVSGIALNGGTEIRPGLKDYAELSEILEALEAD